MYISESIKGIQELLEGRRLHVPELNASDLLLEPNDLNEEQTRAKESRTNLAKKKKTTTANTCSKIIDAHVSSMQSLEPSQSENSRKQCHSHQSYVSETQLVRQPTDINETSTATAFSHQNYNTYQEPYMSNPDDPNENDDLDDRNENVDGDDYYESEDGDDHNQSRANDHYQNEDDDDHNKSQIDELRKEFNSEKQKTKKLARANKLLQEKCMTFNEKLESLANKSTEAEQVKKLYPEPINSKSNIQASSDAVHEAYSKDEPSTFYINMCYAVQGYKSLSTRCLRKTKKTPSNYTLLSPKKMRVIKVYLAHYLQFYKYPESLQQKYYSKIKMYAHRAIVQSRVHMKVIEEYPQLAEEINEIEMINI